MMHPLFTFREIRVRKDAPLEAHPIAKEQHVRFSESQSPFPI